MPVSDLPIPPLPSPAPDNPAPGPHELMQWADVRHASVQDIRQTVREHCKVLWCWVAESDSTFHYSGLIPDYTIMGSGKGNEGKVLLVTLDGTCSAWNSDFWSVYTLFQECRDNGCQCKSPGSPMCVCVMHQ